MTPLEEALAEINKRGSLSPDSSPLGRRTSPVTPQAIAETSSQIKKGFSQYKSPYDRSGITPTKGANPLSNVIG